MLSVDGRFDQVCLWPLCNGSVCLQPAVQFLLRRGRIGQIFERVRKLAELVDRVHVAQCWQRGDVAVA